MRRVAVGELPAAVSSADRVILFDAECVVCNRWVAFVLRWDTRGALKIGSIQSDTGKRLLRYAGLPTDDGDTMLFIDRGIPYDRSSAFLRAASLLAFPLPLLYVWLLVPYFLRDFCYELVATRRYIWFGKQTTCLIPSKEQRARFLPDA